MKNMIPRDTGGDGTPDPWVYTYFPTNPADGAAELDPDGDSLNNVGEYIAGTHPMDDSSVFKVPEVREQAGGIILSWAVQPERQYRVVSIRDLVMGLSTMTCETDWMDPPVPMTLMTWTNASPSATHDVYAIDVRIRP